MKGKLVQPVNRETILQYISTEDIGRVAAKIFRNPERYLNKTIPPAAEQLSAQEVADLFSDALNKKGEYKKLPTLVARLVLGKTVYKMFKWLDEKNRFLPGDMNSTREEFPNLVSLTQWIRNNFPVDNHG